MLSNPLVKWPYSWDKKSTSPRVNSEKKDFISACTSTGKPGWAGLPVVGHHPVEG